MLEIEKQSGFQARDVEIAKHLGDVGFIEIGNHFWIDDDSLVYNQVGDEGANELTVVMNGKLFLVGGNMALKICLSCVTARIAWMDLLVAQP